MSRLYGSNPLYDGIFHLKETSDYELDPVTILVFPEGFRFDQPFWFGFRMMIKPDGVFLDMSKAYILPKDTTELRG